MIFATVGTQLPFDRLMAALDAWAAAHKDEEVQAQIGPSTQSYPHLKCQQFLPPQLVEEYTRKCRLVVAHAGMGSVLTALRFRKPVVLVPRKASLGEHRNEHQLATAKWLQKTSGVQIAWEPDDLPSFLASTQGATCPDIPEFAQPQLIARLRDFMHGSH